MKDPSFPFYVNNWLGSGRVAVMTPEQVGGYLFLLCHAWNEEDCGLPDDQDILAAWSRLNGRWEACRDRILKCFYRQDGRLYNERLMACRTERNEWLCEQRRKGQLGGLAKAKNQSSRGLAVAKPDPTLESESESELEIESESEDKPPCPEPASTPPAEPDVPPTPPVILIPLIPRDGEYGVTQQQIHEWAETYPAVDVIQTLREMRAWCVANPVRRKTRTGAPKFINAWLCREQNKGA